MNCHSWNENKAARLLFSLWLVGWTASLMIDWHLIDWSLPDQWMTTVVVQWRWCWSHKQVNSRPMQYVLAEIYNEDRQPNKNSQCIEVNQCIKSVRRVQRGGDDSLKYDDSDSITSSPGIQECRRFVNTTYSANKIRTSMWVSQCMVNDNGPKKWQWWWNSILSRLSTYLESIQRKLILFTNQVWFSAWFKAASSYHCQQIQDDGPKQRR